MPRALDPSGRRQKILNIEFTASSPGFPLSDEPRGVDLDVAGLLPKHGVESEEEDAEGEVDAHGGHQRRDDHQRQSKKRRSEEEEGSVWRLRARD